VKQINKTFLVFYLGELIVTRAGQSGNQTLMIERDPAAYGRFKGNLDAQPGGPSNPLGARALYLGSTLYRIHGTNQPWTIGGAVSSGCIRMRNEDVTD